MQAFSLAHQPGSELVAVSTQVMWDPTYAKYCNRMHHPTLQMSTADPKATHSCHGTDQGVGLLMWVAAPISPGTSQRSQQLMLVSFCH